MNQMPSSINDYIVAYTTDSGNTATHYAKVTNNVVSARIYNYEVVLHSNINAYFSTLGIPVACFVK